MTPSAVAPGRTRKSRPAKNGGPTCWQTLALASESGAPISQSSKRSIGLPTDGARSYLSRAASAIGGVRFFPGPPPPFLGGLHHAPPPRPVSPPAIQPGRLL